jgi:hypothetical protein
MSPCRGWAASVAPSVAQQGRRGPVNMAVRVAKVPRLRRSVRCLDAGWDDVAVRAVEQSVERGVDFLAGDPFLHLRVDLERRL